MALTAATGLPVPPARGKSDWWRAVLGEYPTGVTLITSLDAQGAPVGMVVGTFTAVSQDPPLIGFLPDGTSTTYPIVAANGSFSASVLGTAHDELCRSFVRKDPDRFSGREWAISADGIPRLADAVAWFDASIEQEVPLGDHSLVVGRVSEFGTGDADAGLPLLFRRAGYGSFQVPSAAVDAAELGRRIRLAEESREIAGRLAETLGVEVMLSAVVHDSVVVLSVTRPAARPGEHASQRSLGVAFPFAAPLAPVFVAWAEPADRAAWIESSRHLVGAVDRDGLARTLDSVRRRGYNVSTDRALGSRFERLVQDDGAGRESFARFWSDLAAENEAVLRSGEILPNRVSSIQAPVFGPDGDVVLVVNANGFEGIEDVADVEAAAAEVVAAATAIGARVSGRGPIRAEG